MRKPEWPVLASSLLESFLYPYWKHPSFGTKTSKPTVHKVEGMGSTVFVSGPLELLIRRTIPFPSLNSWNCDKKHHMVVTYSVHILHPVKHYSCPEKCCHPSGTTTESSKGHSPNLSGQLLQNDGEHDKPSEFYELEPIAIIHLV